jgi:(1->4)-alpha-D-glucan 1-alpha-D-glucosylmutase
VNFSLVDPDNRRPVDFERLARSLRELPARPGESAWKELLRTAADGRIKQLATRQLLHLRRERQALFECGGYLPLTLHGAAAEHAVAFARLHEGDAVLVIAARLTYTLCGGEGSLWSPSVWRDTHLELEGEALQKVASWRNPLTASTVSAGASKLELRQVFAGAGAMPFAVLVPA